MDWERRESPAGALGSSFGARVPSAVDSANDRGPNTVPHQLL